MTQVLLLSAVGADNVPDSYLPLFVLLLLATALAAGMLIISAVIGKRGKTNPAKDNAYECGIEPVGEAHTRFSVKFYLVAVLFILFDIEVVFLYPWAVYFGTEEPELGVFATRGELMTFLFFEMAIFIGILFLGWLWVVKKRALDWGEA